MSQDVDMTEKLYNSKQLAEALGVGRQTIRNWELAGLLVPDFQTAKNKLYNKDSLNKAATIKDKFKDGKKTEEILEMIRVGKL